MFRQLKNNIESKRENKDIFSKSLVRFKDILWRIYNYFYPNFKFPLILLIKREKYLETLKLSLSKGYNNKPPIIIWDGYRRMTMMEKLIKNVILENVPGSLVEVGVWKGGMTIFFKGVLKVNKIKNRKVWNIDSFKGFPPIEKMELKKYPEDKEDAKIWSKKFNYSLEKVKSNFKTFGLLDKNVKFLKGFFKDTLPNSPIQKISVLRIDADQYSSTWLALKYLYPKLSKGGYVVFDDWKLKYAQKAIKDFRKENKIKTPLVFGDTKDPIPYWKKE